MMKPAAAFLMAAVAAAPALANDTTAELSTGGLVFVHNDNVEMASEELTLSSKEISVRYRFLNKSVNPVTVLVAFPLPEIRIDEQDFQPDVRKMPRQHHAGRGFPFRRTTTGNEQCFG